MLSDFEKTWQNKFSQAAQEGGADWQISLWRQEGLASYQRYFLAYSKHVFPKAQANFSVLDVGCGPATFSAILAEKGFRVSAVDYSDEMIERAKEKTQGLTIDFQRADIYDLPFGDNSFDAVICLGVFQTLESPQRALEEIKRVIKPQGTIIITTLNKFSLASSFRGKDRGLDVVSYSPWQFKKIMIKSGLAFRSLKGMYFFPKKLNFLSDFIFYSRVYKLFNLFFFIFSPLSHSFWITAKKI